MSVPVPVCHSARARASYQRFVRFFEIARRSTRSCRPSRFLFWRRPPVPQLIASHSIDSTGRLFPPREAVRSVFPAGRTSRRPPVFRPAPLFPAGRSCRNSFCGALSLANRRSAVRPGECRSACGSPRGPPRTEPIRTNSSPAPADRRSCRRQPALSAAEARPACGHRTRPPCRPPETAERCPSGRH